jgi:hypothetical protein
MDPRAGLLKTVGVRVAERAASKAIHSIPTAVLLKLNKAVGHSLVVKCGKVRASIATGVPLDASPVWGRGWSERAAPSFEPQPPRASPKRSAPPPCAQPPRSSSQRLSPRSSISYTAKPGGSGYAVPKAVRVLSSLKGGRGVFPQGGVIKLHRAVPIVGGMVAGGFDAGACMVVGRVATRMFRPPQEGEESLAALDWDGTVDVDDFTVL